jgi:hypothetical protein
MSHGGVDDDQVTIEVGLVGQGIFNAFRDGSPGIHDAGAGGKEL